MDDSSNRLREVGGFGRINQLWLLSAAIGRKGVSSPQSNLIHACGQRVLNNGQKPTCRSRGAQRLGRFLVGLLRPQIRR